MMPSFTSGCPSWAFSAAKRTVHAIASSSPPPRANPFTAATEGLPQVSIVRNTPCPRSAYSRSSVGESAASSPISAPATKAFSPAPVTMAPRMPGVPRHRRKGVPQLPDHRPRQSVQLLRPVHSHQSNAQTVRLEQDVAIGHQVQCNLWKRRMRKPPGTPISGLARSFGRTGEGRGADPSGLPPPFGAASSRSHRITGRRRRHSDHRVEPSNLSRPSHRIRIGNERFLRHRCRGNVPTPRAPFSESLLQ